MRYVHVLYDTQQNLTINIIFNTPNTLKLNIFFFFIYHR